MKRVSKKMLNLPRTMRSVGTAFIILFLVTIFNSCKDNNEPQDKTAPEVAFENLANGATVWNTISVAVSVTDQNDLKTIDFYVDGNLVTSLTKSPFEISWDSNTVSDGAHTIKVVATDAAGNVTEKEISVTVMNVLVSINIQADMLDNYGDITERGFVFLSDENGKVIATKEYSNGENVALKNPAFNGDKFYLSQVIIYKVGTYSENKIITFAEIDRGKKWVLSKYGGSDEDRAYVGNATLNFSGAAVDAQYGMSTNGDDFGVDQSVTTKTIRLYASPSKLYVVRYNPTTFEPIKYGLYSNITAGTTTAINLASVNKNLTKSSVTAPSAGTINIQLKGYTVVNNYEDPYKIGYFTGNGSADYYYPGTEFPSYYGEVFWKTPDLYYSKGNNQNAFTITPFEKNVSFSLAGEKLTYTATGNFDFISTGFGEDDNSWAFLLPKGTSVVVPKLEFPAILNEFELVSFTTPTEYTLYDFDGVDDYAGFRNYVRTNKTFDSFYDKGKNYADELHYIPSTGGRKANGKRHSSAVRSLMIKN